VAVLLVVLFHAGVRGVGGGYVGVDVFFVISGFVITMVLLRERKSTGSTSIPRFYARRVRRIIPAATFVIIAVVLATYHFLGSASGAEVADDGRWAAVFLANFHFAAAGTNYLASQRPPSPLQNYWSLGVEEQFYLVYPALFLLITAKARHISSRGRLALVLGIVIVSSFSFSVLETSVNSTAAYFSPLARAWELALGGLVAVSAGALRRLPSPVATCMSWLGLGVVLASAFVFSSATSYPGAAVALPVVGTALVISAGTACPVWGAESMLRLRPFQWLGLISYSLYLWHWPILTIAAQRTGSSTLPVLDNLLWVLVALALATLTYLFIEKPFLHADFFMSRRWLSIGFAACLVGSVFVVSSVVTKPSYSYATSLASLSASSACPAPPASTVAALRGQAGLSARSTDAPSRGQLLVLGDSTACTMIAGLDSLGPHYGLQVVNAAVVGCGVVDGQSPNVSSGVDVDPGANLCRKKADAVVTSTLSHSRPALVLWASQWERSDIVRSTSKGQVVLSEGSPAWKAVLERQMDRRLAEFTARGAKVVILTQPAMVDPSNVTRPTQRDESYLRFNTFLREFAAMHEHNVSIIDLAARVCPGGPPCPSVVGGVWARGDDLHYGPEGSLWVARWLMPKLLTGPLHLAAPAPLPSPTPAPHTELLIPTNGAFASGTLSITAAAADNVNINKVQFYVGEGSNQETFLSTATGTLKGFVTHWDTTTVPNGVYELRSVVYDVKGKEAQSKAVMVHVDN
jgi:peptidoglycan/LPS O-acetylase OafA/YrhL